MRTLVCKKINVWSSFRSVPKYNFVHFPFFSRKRILATGAGSLSKMQLPDSTVVSESSSRDSSSISCDTSSAMLSSLSTPSGSKKTIQSRSSLNKLNYESDHSDSTVKINPVHMKSAHADHETSCDSPSTYGLTNPSYNFSKKTSADVDASNLFFPPKKPETAVEKKPQAYLDLDIDPNDFYDDYFDIDDLNDSDIPEYFDEPPAASAPPQKPSTSSAAIKEGGPSKSSWQKSPTTPVSAPKAPPISSPGEDSPNSARSVSPPKKVSEAFHQHLVNNFALQSPLTEIQPTIASEASASPTPRR